MQLFLPHKYVSVCKLLHRRRCIYVTCHIISYVLSQPSWFPTNASTTRRIHVRVRPLKDGCVHTFFLPTKTCLYVTFNIRHHVCHQISNRCSRNDVQPHDSTYEPFSVCNFSHIQNHVWEHWFAQHEGLWYVFTVKRRPFTQLFDLHGRVRMQIFS